MLGECPVTVMIPALNEEACIADVVRSIPGDLVDEVVVVDNGSTDRTSAVAQEAGAAVEYEPTKGYGHALMRGLRRHGRTGIVVFMDGDGADDPADLPTLLAPFADGADLVVGQRSGDLRRTQTFPQRMGNIVVLGLVQALFHRRFADLGPFRAIRAEALRSMEMNHLTYGWTVEMQIKALTRGLKVVEVPVRHRDRIAGQSKVSGNLRAVARAGFVMPLTVVRLAAAERWHVLRQEPRTTKGYGDRR